MKNGSFFRSEGSILEVTGHGWDFCLRRRVVKLFVHSGPLAGNSIDRGLDELNKKMIDEKPAIYDSLKSLLMTTEMVE